MKFSSFVSKGFFPKELVPAFNSDLFSKNAMNILKSTSGYKDTATKLTKFSIPRLNDTRRILSLVDPFHYLKLSKELHDNWKDISNKLNESEYSLTTPIEVGNTVDSKFGYSEILYRKCTYSAGYKYMLKTDISRFHNTIYTHMIPWVFHGKDIAKKVKDGSLLGNRMDRIIRNSNDQQTLGIPTGQILFHIISEVVGTYIDIEFKNRYKFEVKEDLFGFRYTDDFYFFFYNKGDAEKALSILREITLELELELNYLKTNIYELPIPFEQEWITELRKYTFSNKVLAQKNDIINYFSKIFEYKSKYNDEFVIKYALARIKNIKFNKGNWSIYEGLLLQCISAEGSVIPVVLEIILKYEKEGVKLDRKKIKRVASILIEGHLRMKHTFEVIWLLWLFKSLKIKINKDIIKLLELSTDDFIILVTCDLEKFKLLNSNLDKSNWLELINEKNLKENHWLLIYESYINKFIDVDKSLIQNNLFFKCLEKNSIRFYDDSRQIYIEEFEIDESNILEEIMELIDSLNIDGDSINDKKVKLQELIKKRNKNLGY